MCNLLFSANLIIVTSAMNLAFRSSSSMIELDDRCYKKIVPQVYARKKWYKFGTEQIKENFLHPFSIDVKLEESYDSVVKTITNGVHLTRPEAADLQASTLKSTYAGMFAIATRNWIPNN